jgi:hypothetical protein
MRMGRLVDSSVLAIAAVVVLAGCTTAPNESSASTSPSPSPSVSRGFEDGSPLPPVKEKDPQGWTVHVVQDDENVPNTFLRVTTMGSGSCPVTVDSVTVVADNWLRIQFNDPFSDGAVCTSDLRPHTDQVPMPSGIDLFSPITAVLERNDREVAIEVQVPGRGIQQGNVVS